MDVTTNSCPRSPITEGSALAKQLRTSAGYDDIRLQHYDAALLFVSLKQTQ